MDFGPLWNFGPFRILRTAGAKHSFGLGCRELPDFQPITHLYPFSRLNPKNIHQRPTVALLCGPHVKGAQGISCGRHLANHDVQVILFLPNFVKMLESITNELSLFCKTQGQQVSSLKGEHLRRAGLRPPLSLVIWWSDGTTQWQQWEKHHECKESSYMLELSGVYLPTSHPFTLLLPLLRWKMGDPFIHFTNIYGTGTDPDTGDRAIDFFFLLNPCFPGA